MWGDQMSAYGIVLRGSDVAILAVAFLLAARPAPAIDTFWSNNRGDGSGTFSSATNWSISVPGASDVAHFGMTTSNLNPKTYTVAFTNDPTNLRLRVEDDSVTFDLNSHFYQATSPIAIEVGTESGRSGQLTVTDGLIGTPLGADIHVGSVAGAAGALNVTTGGLVLGSPDVVVGRNSSGTLNISNNGDIIASDVTLGMISSVTGTATITGAGSSLLADQLVVGSSGIGVLNITASGRVDSTDGIIADAVGSSGTAIISGANSRWQISQRLEVGLNGTGTLRIENGGIVRDEEALVRGSVFVTGGSTWVNNGVLNLGRNNATIGELTIESGSHVQSGNSNVAFGNGKSIVIVRDNGTTWTNSDALNVGSSGDGELTIESGAAVTSVGGSVATFGGSSGIARIIGSTSTWNTSGDFVVGGGGVGQLDINSGKLMFTNESDLIVGNSASGRMTITSGGQALDAFETVVGKLAGSSGELTVTGPNSQLRVLDRLSVGDGGSGMLEVTDGGRVSNDDGIIRGSDSSVRVQGADSAWANGGILNLFNNAALLIEDGGTVLCAGSVISGSSDATSVVTVSNGTWANSGFLSVGSDGAGSLAIEAGGRVDNQMSDIGVLSDSTGSATIGGAGSTWTIAGNLRVGGDGINNGGVGTLRIQTGSKVVVDGSTKIHQGDLVALEGGTLSTLFIDFVQGHGTFQWTGGTLHLVQYDGNLLVPDGGIFAPGTIAEPSNHAMIFGGYTQRAGGAIEFNDLSAFVNVADTAVLGGKLAIDLNGDVPDPLLSYTIFDALSIFGTFSNVANGQRLNTADGLGSFIVNYGAGSAFDPTQIVLSSFLAAGVPGDYNQNGEVDAADYVLWRDNLGSGVSLPNDDTPGVGQDDYTRWRIHFGQTAGSGGGGIATAGVPEPATAILFVLGAVIGCCKTLSARLGRIETH